MTRRIATRVMARAVSPGIRPAEASKTGPEVKIRNQSESVTGEIFLKSHIIQAPRLRETSGVQA